MKFSIIIPLYNKAPYIRKALESVFAQTYTDYELIIVDDGSTDGSAEIVEQLLASPKSSPEGKEYELENNSLPFREGQGIGCIPSLQGGARGRLISQANAGVSAARNAGVAASTGSYVAFLDADDWWEPTYLERMAQLIADYPDAGLFATNYIYYKPGKTHVALKLPRGYMNYPEAYLHSDMMPVTSITTCMPRRVFDEIGGFPMGIKLGEDFLLWAKTAIHYPIAFCEKPLAYYNNDVPAPLRATRNLHAPEYHMLFHLDPLLDEINRLQSTSNKAVWIQLIDKLRVDGLLDYWMSETYHHQAEVELKKVACPLPKAYSMPLWWLRAKKHIMTIGSYCKHRLLFK